MIKQVSHTVAGADPAGLALALAVAHELHAPAPRAPEVALTTGAGRRATAAAARRRRRALRG
ncbi:hypothetical protein [Streptomyces lincolnensis]|uniref:hypothetical protein n=1 Tax=Streptomyces lincolnensis TaxID=1915 RepID=UPI0037D6960E